MSFVNTLIKNQEQYDITHIEDRQLEVRNNGIKLGNRITPISDSSRAKVEDFFGFSKKMSHLSNDFKDQAIKRLVENGPEDFTVVRDGKGEIIDLRRGHVNPISLDPLFKTLERHIPNGEVSLFKSNGFTTEFAITTPEITTRLVDHTLDETRGGIYLRAQAVSGAPRLSVVPVLHRMSCKNQMSADQKRNQVEVSGDDFEDVLGELDSIVGNIMTQQVPENLKSWLALSEMKPHDPMRYANVLMAKANVGKKIREKVRDRILFSQAMDQVLTAFDVVNMITDFQHGVSDAQRDSLWALGDLALVGHQNCDRCEGAL